MGGGTVLVMHRAAMLGGYIGHIWAEDEEDLVTQVDQWAMRPSPSSELIGVSLGPNSSLLPCFAMYSA